MGEKSVQPDPGGLSQRPEPQAGEQQLMRTEDTLINQSFFIAQSNILFYQLIKTHFTFLFVLGILLD